MYIYIYVHTYICIYIADRSSADGNFKIGDSPPFRGDYCRPRPVSALSRQLTTEDTCCYDRHSGKAEVLCKCSGRRCAPTSRSTESTRHGL